MTYEQMWAAWAAFFVTVIVVAIVSARTQHPLARDLLGFMIGLVVGAVVLLVCVGLPLAVIGLLGSFAFGGKPGLATSAISYAVGAAILYVVGRGAARMDVPRALVAGSVASLLVGVVRTLGSIATGRDLTPLPSLGLAAVLGAALAFGYGAKWREGGER